LISSVSALLYLCIKSWFGVTSLVNPGSWFTDCCSQAVETFSDCFSQAVETILFSLSKRVFSLPRRVFSQGRSEERGGLRLLGAERDPGFGVIWPASYSRQRAQRPAIKVGRFSGMISYGTSSVVIPREQKMLKGHLPRVIYITQYTSVRRKVHP